MDRKRIRNFAIIAHIDHGKSTLADRLLEATGAIADRDKREQFLDNMDLERERGITIKAQTVRLAYRAADGETYHLNLIDTPGHVDFHYEVSRSLGACEGALLVVDAAQGVEAQTLANVFLAIDNDLEVIVVLNKIDLPAADVSRVAAEIEAVIGIDASGAIAASAKVGKGIPEILEAVVQRVPPPGGDPDGPLRALIMDSWFDSYRGVVALVRVVDGTLRKRDAIRMMAAGTQTEVTDLGIYAPFATSVGALQAGEVGYVVSMVKQLDEVKIGDTITSHPRGAEVALAGFQEVKPVVFAGLYPTDPGQFEVLRAALGKLRLNDSSFTFEPESSAALGFGFRCGFLGLLHMEIIQERLEREYNVGLITTAPTVVYHALLYEKDADGEPILQQVETPTKLPRADMIDRVEEPYIRATIHLPSEHLGAVIALCQERRGIQTNMTYAGTTRVLLEYELPLADVLFDFFDKLKSVSRGYASLDYQLIGYRAGDLVKLDVMVNGDPVDTLSSIVHKDAAYRRGRELVQKLKEIIPRQMFEIKLQAAIGSRIIARETIKPFRKDVTAKLYGGDVTRKRKLLEKQKAGKKRMKKVGSVDIPQEAFLSVLRVGQGESK